MQKLGPLISNVEAVAPRRPGVHKLHQERKLCSAPHTTRSRGGWDLVGEEAAFWKCCRRSKDREILMGQ